MAEKAGDIEWHIGTVMDGFNAGMRKAQKGAQKLGKQLQANSKAIGLSMTAAGVAGVAAFGTLASKAQEFSTVMAEVNTLGIADLESLSDAVKDVSTEFGLNLADSAKAAYQAISAGATEAQTPKLLAEAAMAATAGVTDLTTAIELGTSVTNAFGIGIGRASEVFDQAFVAVKGGVTTFEELSASVGKLSPIMSAAGLSTGEMFSAIGALTKGGISTSEAVTGLKAAITGILKPTSEAQQLAADLGIQFDAAGLKSMGLGGFMEQLRQKTGGNIETMAQLFGSVEALNSVLALTGNQAESFNSLLDQMNTATGASQEAFNAFVEANPGFAFQQLRAEVSVLAVELGSALLPTLIMLTRKIVPIIDTVVEWIKNNPKLTESLVVLAAGLAAVMAVVGPLLVMLPGVVSLFGLISSAAPVVGAALAALTGPIGLVVAAVVALVAIVAFNWEKFKELTILTFQMVARAINHYVNLSLLPLKILIATVKEAISFLKDLGRAVVGAAGRALGIGGGGGAGPPIALPPTGGGGGTRSLPAGFASGDAIRSSGGGGGGGGTRGFGSSVTQEIHVHVEGALNASEIVDTIRAPLLREMATGLKQAMA